MRYTDDDVRRELEGYISEAGSLRKAAQALGVSPSYLSMVRLDVCPPSLKLAEGLGFSLDGLRWIDDPRKRKNEV